MESQILFSRWFRKLARQSWDLFAEAEGEARGTTAAGSQSPQQDTVSAGYLLQDLLGLSPSHPPRLACSRDSISIQILMQRYELQDCTSLHVHESSATCRRSDLSCMLHCSGLCHDVPLPTGSSHCLIAESSSILLHCHVWFSLLCSRRDAGTLSCRLLQYLAAALPQRVACLVAEDTDVAPGGTMGDSQSPSPARCAEQGGLQRSDTAPLTR